MDTFNYTYALGLFLAVKASTILFFQTKPICHSTKKLVAWSQIHFLGLIVTKTSHFFNQAKLPTKLLKDLVHSMNPCPNVMGAGKHLQDTSHMLSTCYDGNRSLKNFSKSDKNPNFMFSPRQAAWIFLYKLEICWGISIVLLQW